MRRPFVSWSGWSCDQAKLSGPHARGASGLCRGGIAPGEHRAPGANLGGEGHPCAAVGGGLVGQLGVEHRGETNTRGPGEVGVDQSGE
ncbi:hypothetical protein [Rhodococcus sp. ABRD24]|uniref:hypothetical protein n=1 Tax=Rhodococcus sp. ABRD24 TaxID=2507582 RepID=UPI00325B6DE9